MKAESLISAFRQWAENPHETAKKLKQEQGCPIVGHACTYFPEEIVLAAGGHPMRIFGTTSSIIRADAHIQAYSCSLARSLFEDALSGKLDYLDIMTFPHSCDTIQRLSDIWRLNIKNTVHLDLLFPVHLKSKAARDYMETVIERFRIELGEALRVNIPDNAISEAICLMNRIRTALTALYEVRSARPELISGHDLAHVLQGAMVMDRQIVATHLEELAAALQKNIPSTDALPAKRILLSGGVCLHPDIHNIIEEQGGAVVWDDLCTGNRYFDTLVPKDIPPVRAIANRFLSRAICPAKHSGITRRIEDLVKLASEQRADGVIFLFLKFCDPHGFDYPDLKTALENRGIPTLLLEVESGKPVDGPTRTRIETFLQILNQRGMQP